MKLGKWPKFQKLHVYNLNYSRVPDFTHSEVVHIPSFYPMGLEIELICALRAAVSEIRRAHFQKCHIWA